jgi:type II secretory pathway pseudopilin PulG
MSDIESLPDAPPARPRRGPRVMTLMVVVLIIGSLVGLGTRSLRQAREAANASACLCNLCAIKMALLQYHDQYGSFPPAYVVDADGKRLHSWRVLILPFLSQESLYASYRMDEPWDGPNNRRLIEQRPTIFDCPSRRAGRGLTSYVAIVGPGTAFPGPGTTKLGDIHDGPGRTILVAEVSNVDIAWTEPRDLDAETMSWIIDDPSRPSISSPHGAGPAVVFADYTYRRLGTYHPPDELKAMTTINGGEHVEPGGPH